MTGGQIGVPTSPGPFEWPQDVQRRPQETIPIIFGCKRQFFFKNACFPFRKIEVFEGDNETIKNVESHYQRISKMFNISKNIVDSWHAGIHPGTYYNKHIEENPDRWSNTIFGSPKYLHFHTCGDYPPGEICWMIENPSITIQNVPLWENGNLMLKNFLETRSLLEKWVDLKKLFVN